MEKLVLGELFQVDVTLDAKGRLMLPARLRRKLEAGGIASVILMFIPGMSLFGFTPAEFERQVMSRLADSDPFNPNVLTFAHGVVAGATDVEVDGQGRILIPPKLREKAGLEKDVVVQSFLNRLEIWDASRWAAREKEAEKTAPSLGGIPWNAARRAE